MTHTYKVSTPVVLLIFNRPDTTAKVFNEIRRVKPSKLLVVADGHRPDCPGDEEKCAASRAIIDQVDWPCEVSKNYSDTNLGCKKRVSSGLDWAFSNVEEAIVLEDDCIPQPTFFRFCDELLEKYRYDNRIMMISGFNGQIRSNNDTHSYFFSKYPHIWGWASWRRAWQYYDVNMTGCPALLESEAYKNLCESKDEDLFWRKYFAQVYEGEIDTWDAQVTFMLFSQNGLAVVPSKNLIRNIGFRDDATHTKAISKLSHVEIRDMEFPLNHPEYIVRDKRADAMRRLYEYSSYDFKSSLKNKMILTFKGIW